MERQEVEAGNFAREAKPEYLSVILDALTGYPDAEFIEYQYTEMDYYLDAVSDILNQWALIEPEFVLSNTIACLREHLRTPHRSTILIAMINLNHAYLPRYIDPAMMDFEDYTNDDRIWLATAIGNSRGIGAADLLTRLLANTPETMTEAYAEVRSYLFGVQQKGERSDPSQR